MKKTFAFETLQLHAGQEQPDIATDARAVPIYQTAAYAFHGFDHAAARFNLTDAGNIYGRLNNSTQAVLEERITALEGGVGALATASGAAAVAYTLQALAKAGDHVVAADNLYGGTYNYLKHTAAGFGLSADFVPPRDLSAIEKAIRPNTKLIFIESLGNPNSDTADLEAIAKIAHAHHIPLVVDSTFATPYLLRPIAYGADVVVHSATKFIGGHGTTLGGLIVDGGRFDWTESGRFPQLSEPCPSYHGLRFTEAAGPAALTTYIRAVLLRDTGASISPFNAFLLLQGLETLSLRVERHVENALRVVSFLQNHPQVKKVHHPSVDETQKSVYDKYYPNGAGSIFSFDIRGGQAAAKAFIDRLALFSIVANVADAKSLAIHPATTTHSQLTKEELAQQGIAPGTIRLSIGLEHINDILADLESGFAAAENTED